MTPHAHATDAGQKFMTFFVFKKVLILDFFVYLILLVGPPYFQGRLIMG